MKTRVHRSPKQYKDLILGALKEAPHGLSTAELAEATGIIYNTLVGSMHRKTHAVKRLINMGFIEVAKGPYGAFIWSLKKPEQQTIESVTYYEGGEIDQLEAEVISSVKALARAMARDTRDEELFQIREEMDALKKRLKESEQKVVQAKNLAEHREQELKSKKRIFGF